MGIKHKKHSDLPDGPDAAGVHPSDWNDDHDIDGVLAKWIALAPTPDSFPYITTDGSGAMAPISVPARGALAQPTKALIISALGGIGADSPAFTGTPTAPTPADGDNSQSISTTAFVHNAIAALVASAPTTLDTLNEIAVALGNDANFSASITATLGFRLRFDAPQALTAQQQMQARQNLGLGTAATLDVGMSANKVVQLDDGGKLPPIDGSQLTNLPSGVAGPGYGGSSATSLTPSTGSKVFATQAGLAYTTGSRVRATSVSNLAVWMEGIVSAYAAGSMAINVDAIGATTAKADWGFSIAGSQGAAGAQPIGTSTTSVTPSVASKVFTTQAGLAFAAGTRIRAASASVPAVWIEGQVTAYSGTSLTVNADLIGTATAKADWNITIAGERGAQGAQGGQGPAGAFPTGAGAVGTFAVGQDNSGPLNSGSAPYGGNWNPVSAFNGGGSTFVLYQRIA
jgi:hypothetical protein